MSPPVALLITPVLPLPGGSGRALRAWDWLSELARSHRVHVAVCSPQAQVFDLPPDYPAERVWNLSGEIHGPRRTARLLGLACPWLALVWPGCLLEGYRVRHDAPGFSALRETLDAAPPARIVVFRLALHFVAVPLLARWPQAQAELDLDDAESRTRWSVGGALLRLGRWREALRETLIGSQYALLERFTRGRYGKAWLACAEDGQGRRTHLAAQLGCRPNRLAGGGLSDLDQASARQLLFVGTLDYPPNEEAVRFLLRQVLPPLAAEGWRLTVAGRQATPALRAQLAACPQARLADAPTDLAEYYRQAQIVLVPLRAGGGTKLKTLEAFAHGRPVIATAQGVRGLAARDGEHYLGAETAQQFIQAIRRLGADPSLLQHLASAGHSLWLNRYTCS